MVARTARGVLDRGLGPVRGGRRSRRPSRCWPASTCRTTRFFPEARLNVAENLLHGWDGEEPAIIAHDEAGHRRELSGRRLREEVAALAAALQASGVTVGDRVAAWLPNGPEAVVAMLAATSLGASVLLVLARLRQPTGCSTGSARSSRSCCWRPTATATTATAIDCLERLAGDPAGLPTLRDHRRGPDAVGRTRTSRDHCGGEVGRRTWPAGRSEPTFVPAPLRPSLVRPVLLGHHRPAEVHRPPRRWRAAHAPEGAPAPVRHPPGRPGPLLHDDRLDDVELAGVGAGVRRHHRALRRLAVRARPGSRSSTSSTRRASACSASPPSSSTRWPRPASSPDDTHGLASLRTICSTGSPLSPEGFRYVYEHGQGRRAPGLDLGRHRSVRLLRRAAIRPARCTPARSSGRRSAWPSTSGPTRPASAARRRRRRRAGLHRARSPRCRSGFWDDGPLGAVGRVPRRLLRAVPGGVVPGRLRLVDRARRHRHPRPQRRHAQPRRRPHRHRRHLPRRRAACPSVVEALVFGQQWEGDVRIVLVVRLQPGVSLDDACGPTCAPSSAGSCPPVTCPRSSWPWTTCPAPAAASWSSWPWPTRSTAGR